jgi:hypothetical protein
MDSTTLCKWDDIGALLGAEDRREYAALPCPARLALAANAWWLGRPLFSRPGNDRRSEHDSRLVMARLSETGLNPTWLKWGDDMAEIVVRLGWPAYWRRYWSSMGDPNAPNPHITQYSIEPSYHFLPTLEAIREPELALPAHWNLLPDDSREEYAPEDVTFGRLSQQTARLLRGDSLLLVARVSVAMDSVLNAKATLRGGFAFARDPADVPQLYSGSRTPPEFLLASVITNEDRVAGIELTGEGGVAARSRFGVKALSRDPRGHAISDLVLVQAELPEKVSLSDALPSMSPSLELDRGRGTSIYWELYGVARDDNVEYTLSVHPGDKTLVRKVGEFLRLVPRTGTTRVRWSERVESAAAILPRAVKLDLRSLRAGRHDIVLTTRVNYGAPLVTSRVVEVRGG